MPGMRECLSRCLQMNVSHSMIDECQCTSPTSVLVLQVYAHACRWMCHSCSCCALLILFLNKAHHPHPVTLQYIGCPHFFFLCWYTRANLWHNPIEIASVPEVATGRQVCCRFCTFANKHSLQWLYLSTLCMLVPKIPSIRLLFYFLDPEMCSNWHKSF